MPKPRTAPKPSTNDRIRSEMLASALAEDLPGGNQPPVLTDPGPQQAHPNQLLFFTVTAVDPDGDTLEFSLINAPAGASIHPSTGDFTWTPAWGQLGDHTLTIKVDDGNGGTDQKNCTVSVVNQPPSLSAMAALQGHPEQAISFFAVAVDPDGDLIEYTLVSPPAGASIHPVSGQFTWSPAWGQLGDHTITVKAEDAGGATDQKDCVIRVLNQPPTLSAMTPVTSHPEQTINFFATASDPDGDALEFSLVTPPAGASIHPVSGQFTWTPTWAQLGTHNINIRVCDPGGLADQKSCTVVVANQPPVLVPMAAIQTHPEQTVNFFALAADPDGDSLEYSLVAPPAGATIHPASGQVTWTPTWAQLGSHNLNVRVVDPGGLADQKAYAVTVANDPPAIDALQAQSVVAGSTLNFFVSASDPDGDTLEYSLVNPPAGATINPASGAFDWTPTSAQTGNHTISVRVTDPGGLADQKSFTVTVT